MSNQKRGARKHSEAIAENEASCRKLLRHTQVAMLDAFAFEYQKSGRLVRNRDSWGMTVERDIHFILMAADIRREETEIATLRIALAWGAKYVRILERREMALRASAGGNAGAPCQASGFVYVLRNKCLPGLVKIGMTTATPQERARQLSYSTSIPEPFELVAAFQCKNPKECEAEIHAELAAHRRPGKEFFAVSEDCAVTVCERIARGVQ